MCMSIKFRPREHWKVISKNIDREDIRVVPVWKILGYKRNYDGEVRDGIMASPFHNYEWHNGLWNVALLDSYPFNNRFTYKVIEEGFHCYYRKQDALNTFPIWLETETASDHIHRSDYVVVKMYTKPEDIVDKGYSFCDKYGNGGLCRCRFKQGWVANDSNTIDDLKAKYLIIPTLVTTKLFLPK